MLFTIVPVGDPITVIIIGVQLIVVVFTVCAKLTVQVLLLEEPDPVKFPVIYVPFTKPDPLKTQPITMLGSIEV
jgi:hypothetical protein